LPSNNSLKLHHDRASSPLLITPRWESSLEFLQTFLTTNRDWLTQQLALRGAVLVRGFDIHNAVDLQTAIQSYRPALNNTYRGTSPRHVLDNAAEYVFSAAEVPTHYPIAQHLEMSFLPEPPSQLYFGCLQPSQSSGGETALCDFRRVAADLPFELKHKLLQKGIRYTRTHTRHGNKYTYDVSEMLGWQDLFGTSSKEEVERICHEEGTPVSWTGPNHDTFVSVTHSPAFQLHPTTNEVVWFNHTQVFHWTTFAAELWFAFRRTYEVRLFLHFLWIALYSLVRYGLLRHTMSLQADLGDGTPITVHEMSSIRSAIHRNMVFSRWQKGDVMMIDNFGTSHGRQPTYDKGRKIAVAWADPLKKSNAVTSFDAVPIKNLATEAVQQQQHANPQERTPETTLTQTDAAALQEQVLKDHFLKAFGAAASSTASSPNDPQQALQTLFHRRPNSYHSRSRSAVY
jgi:alpha-ketoglutarate-dependent taurine dioxygenase